MVIPRRSNLFLLTLLGALVNGCGESTAPDTGIDFDSDATLSAYEAMDSLLASPVLAGFQALAGRSPFSGSSTAGAIAGALPQSSTTDGGRAFATDLATRLLLVGSAAGGPATSPIISDLHRGKTFVYDPVEDRYAHDPTREGAPATGVRLVLYEVDLSGKPIVEEEVGYADLIDEGDESREDVALRLTVFAYETTVLDYRTSLDVVSTGGTLGVHGFLQEPDGPRLDFHIDASSTRVGEGDPQIDVAFELDVDVRDFSVMGTLSGIDGDRSGDCAIEMIVRHAEDSIRLDVETVDGHIDGTVFVNGAVFANVTGDVDGPEITSATGEALTLGEILLLRHIVDGAEDVFDLLEDLLDPVDELIILALIL